MKQSDPQVYLRSSRIPEGRFLPLAEALIRPDDRGFQFGDGAYEVIRSYGGRPFLMVRHLARLRRNLGELRIGFAEVDGIAAVADRLIVSNRLLEGDATVYVQVTRGAAPRLHPFPDPPVTPTVFVQASAFKPDPAAAERGVMAITVPDIRWSRCDIKTVCLLPNALARQQAREAGAADAILVRNGLVTESTHANVFGVSNGELLTHPCGPHILDGITRQAVLEFCAGAGIVVRETAVAEASLPGLDELFLAGTTVEITPVTRLDGRPVGSGSPGPVTRRVQAGFRALV